MWCNDNDFTTTRPRVDWFDELLLCYWITSRDWSRVLTKTLPISLKGGRGRRVAGRELFGDIEQRHQLASAGPSAVRRLQLPRRRRQRTGAESAQPRVLLHGHSSWRLAHFNVK